MRMAKMREADDAAWVFVMCERKPTRRIEVQIKGQLDDENDK